MQANYKMADHFKQKVSLTNVELIAKKNQQRKHLCTN
jgi:hypothetical protein